MKDYGRTLELQASKDIECSKVDELLYGSVEGKSVERNAENGSQIMKFQSNFKDFIGIISYFKLGLYSSCQLGLKSQS